MRGDERRILCMRWVLRAGALGRPRGMGWRGRREGESGWAAHVNPWLIHVNVWQKPLQYCKVFSLQRIKINEKKKRSILIGSSLYIWQGHHPVDTGESLNPPCTQVRTSLGAILPVRSLLCWNGSLSTSWLRAWMPRPPCSRTSWACELMEAPLPMVQVLEQLYLCSLSVQEYEHWGIWYICWPCRPPGCRQSHTVVWGE